MKTPFYHETIRKLVIAFGTLFNELQIDREDSGGKFQTIPIPIIYNTKEKFILRINEIDDIASTKVRIEETLPRMGYELTNVSYDTTRKTNTMVKLRGSNDNIFSFNRVPYKFGFSLYIASRKIDDSLRIIEQIVPYFTPELTLTIKDMTPLDISTDVPLVLEATNFEVDSEGGFDDRRVVFWSLDFTIDAYLYAAIRDTTLIKKTTIDFKDINNSNIFESYLAEVDPLNASSSDNYTIKEEIII
jgi:hypothetical protein